jgi:hypothetical protein
MYRYFQTLFCLIIFLHATLGFSAISNDQSNSLLTQWVQAKSSGQTKSQTEIWSRVRSRLHIATPTSAALYQRHVKQYARSQSYINKLADNASPYH